MPHGSPRLVLLPLRCRTQPPTIHHFPQSLPPPPFSAKQATPNPSPGTSPMKREGYQHGAVRVNRNKLLRVAGNGNANANGDAALELVAGGVAYARAPTKPTNASRDTGGRCRRPRCAGCHQHPPPASTKARDKAKGARKLRASDVALNHRLVSWRVVSGAGDGPAATGGYNYRGASASAVLAHLAGGNSWHADDDDDDEDQDGADLEAAAPRGISDLYDLIVGLQAGAAPAPGGEEEDAHGTAAAAADTHEIEEQDAGITDDVDDEDEEEDDDGFCVVQGITIALEFSDGEEDWIVV